MHCPSAFRWPLGQPQDLWGVVGSEKADCTVMQWLYWHGYLKYQGCRKIFCYWGGGGGGGGGGHQKQYNFISFTNPLCHCLPKAHLLKGTIHMTTSLI